MIDRFDICGQALACCAILAEAGGFSGNAGGFFGAWIWIIGLLIAGLLFDPKPPKLF